MTSQKHRNHFLALLLKHGGLITAGSSHPAKKATASASGASLEFNPTEDKTMTTSTIQEIAEQQTQRRYAAEVTKHVALEEAGGLASNMTLRDHFAGQALIGICSLGRCTRPEIASENAYEMADAMLEARKTTGEGE
jgi:hypothetical protein